MSVHAHLDQATLQAVLSTDFPVLVRISMVDSEARIATLRTVIASPDHAAVRDAPHSLKGSSLQLGQHPRHAHLEQAPALLAALEAEFRLVANLLTTAARG